ncbi:MAG TPA: YkgJ family cysteine cluster protein [Pyrinomonadaceae bacterium]|nr:YkgJ family cysteine cluster protein [Pyrinomonadaceae bacterium]
MGTISPTPKPKSYYDCVDCPAYCCSVYERVQVTPRDIRRLAKHFGVTEDVATVRFTKVYENERVLRRKKDKLFAEACQFINQDTRGCTIYNARPAVCREFPTTKRCAYYDLLTFEREQQDDHSVVPLVKITFRDGKK